MEAFHWALIVNLAYTAFVTSLWLTVWPEAVFLVFANGSISLLGVAALLYERIRLGDWR